MRCSTRSPAGFGPSRSGCTRRSGTETGAASTTGCGCGRWTAPGSGCSPPWWLRRTRTRSWAGPCRLTPRSCGPAARGRGPPRRPSSGAGGVLVGAHDGGVDRHTSQSMSPAASACAWAARSIRSKVPSRGHRRKRVCSVAHGPVPLGHDPGRRADEPAGAGCGARRLRRSRRGTRGHSARAARPAGASRGESPVDGDLAFARGASGARGGVHGALQGSRPAAGKGPRSRLRAPPQCARPAARTEGVLDR